MMLHITIERADITEATRLAREVYQLQVQRGRHVLLDAPGDFRTNLPERRLSAADVLVTARQFAPNTSISPTKTNP